MAREFRLTPAGCKLVIKQGDITVEEVDAIVNAANERMLGGGGVDGAIHRAAGRELYKACLEVPEVEPGVRCPTGEARITEGFHLPARHVIHTVGPIYEGDQLSQPLLASAYRSSMALALEHELRSVSFPAISCGVFGYPSDKGAQVAVSSVRSALLEAGESPSVSEVRFVLFGKPLYDAWVRAAEQIAEGEVQEGEEDDDDGEDEDEREEVGEGEDETEEGHL